MSSLQILGSFFKSKVYRWLWNNNINETHINELTPQGYEDSYAIGMRFKQKYPDLFKDYDPDHYYVSIASRYYNCGTQPKLSNVNLKKS